MHPIQMIGGSILPALAEDIYPDSDSLTTLWEDEGGATSNLWQSVDDKTGDSDYVTLTTQIPDTADENNKEYRTIRFSLENPTSTPQSPLYGQSITYYVRCTWVEVTPPGSPATIVCNMTMRLKEGTTTVRSSDSGNSVVENTYTTFADVITASEYNNITDWDNLYLEVEFECYTDTSGGGQAGEFRPRMSAGYMTFS